LAVLTIRPSVVHELVASNATVVVLKNTGRWLMEEQPRDTMDALVRFLP